MQGYLNGLPFAVFRKYDFKYLRALKKRSFVAVMTGRVANI